MWLPALCAASNGRFDSKNAQHRTDKYRPSSIFRYSLGKPRIAYEQKEVPHEKVVGLRSKKYRRSCAIGRIVRDSGQEKRDSVRRRATTKTKFDPAEGKTHRSTISPLSFSILTICDESKKKSFGWFLGGDSEIEGNSEAALTRLDRRKLVGISHQAFSGAGCTIVNEVWAARAQITCTKNLWVR